MEIQVYRTGASSYQNSHFLNLEQKKLEEISGVKYLCSLKETSRDKPYILITNTHSNMEMIPDTILNRTKLLIHPNSGFDNIDSKFIKGSKFPIIVGNPIRANAVAEYILSCIFRELTSIPNQIHWSEDRIWNRKLLRDQKILILGHGHIGKILTQSLSPLALEVRVFDPNSNLEEVEKTFHTNLFSEIDILIIAADLNETSKGMVNIEALNKLSNSNIIINTARGGIIKENELVQYLQKNKNSKCYLDVFENEPYPPGYLNQIDNLNKTSHIAGVYQKLNQDIINFEYLVIKDFIDSHKENSRDFQNDYSECIINQSFMTV